MERASGFGAGGPGRRTSRRREDRLGEHVPARRPWWGYVWAAPNTLVGLAGAATVLARPRRWRGVLLFEDVHGGLARLLAKRGFAAITLGHVLIVNRRASDHLLAHELTHVRQHERWGPAFYPAYLLLSLRGYRRNPFELAARKVEEAIREVIRELDDGVAARLDDKRSGEPG